MSGRPAARDASLFLWIVLACTVIAAVQFTLCARADRCILAEDFEVFYNPARLMAAGAKGSPYPLEAARSWVNNPAKGGLFHYSLYPPHSLLLFSPLGYFTPYTALALWYAVQLAALGGALLLPYWRSKLLLATLALLLPFVMISMYAGQVGILCAALFIATFAWRNSRPVLAALALALLTLKPQLALMLPVLLLVERNFRVLFMAAGFTLALVGVSFAVLGIGAWRDYLALLALSPQLLDIAPPQLLTVSLSPALALRMIGFAAPFCLTLQAFLTAGVLLLTFMLLPKAEESDKLTLIAAATFLVSPYSFHYDAVLLAFPAMMLMRRWLESEPLGRQRMALIMLVFIPLVALKLQRMHIPYGFFAILTLYMETATGVRMKAKAIA